jgi:hypothetical protein
LFEEITREAGTIKDWTVLLCSAAAVGQPTGTAGRAGLVEGAAAAWGKSHPPIVGVTAAVLSDCLEWQDAKIRERLGLWRRNIDDKHRRTLRHAPLQGIEDRQIRAERDGHVGTVGSSSPTLGLLRAGDSVACESVGTEGEGRD